MTEPFVAQLRTRGDTIELASPGGPAITVRVEMPEVWDVFAMSVAPTESLLTVKQAALDALYPTAKRAEDFVLKYKGWEILNERASLADAGVVDGGILLLTYRRRRAVR